MSIDPIKNIQTNIVTSKDKQSFSSEPETQVTEHKNGKVLLMTGLAALGAVGIYLATRGKKGGSNVTEGTQRPVEQVKDLAIDAFKQAGNKFEKGVAKLANGENYTGKLTQKLKDGKVVVREYKNGVLQNTKKLNGEEVVFSKIYNYDNNGNLTKVLNKRGNILFERRTIGNYTRINTKDGFCILEDNALKYRQDYKTGDIFAYDEQGKISGIIHSYSKGTKRMGCYSYGIPDGFLWEFDRTGKKSFGYSKNLKSYTLWKGSEYYKLTKDQTIDINGNLGEQFYDYTQSIKLKGKSEKTGFIIGTDGTISECDIPLDEAKKLLSDFIEQIKPLHKKALKIISAVEENNNLFYPKA